MVDFYILGNPRSGTTLLRLMLSTHSNMIVPPEAGFAVWLLKQSNLKEYFTIDGFIDEIYATKKFENYNLEPQLLKAFLIDNNVTDLVAACHCVYLFFAKNQNKPNALIGDKNNFYISNIDSLERLSPNAKYIHIVRDGRDVACSYITLMKKNIVSKHAPVLSQNIKEIAQEWYDNNLLAVNGLIGKPHLVIRLEDLVENPEDILTGICEFIGVPFESDMLKYHNPRNSSHYEPSEFDQWKGKNKKPIINENYKYKNEMSLDEIAEFNDIAGELLDLFNY